MEVLRRFKALAAELPVIMLTTHGGIIEAVEAIKLGAEDFLIRPVQPAPGVRSRHALERRALKTQVANLRRTQNQGALELHQSTRCGRWVMNLKSDFIARMSHG